MHALRRRQNVRNQGGGGGACLAALPGFAWKNSKNWRINPRVKMRTGEWSVWSSNFLRWKSKARIQRATTGRFRGACSSRGEGVIYRSERRYGDALHKLQVVGCFLRGSPAAAKLNIKMPRISGRSDTDPGRLHEGKSVPCTIATRFIDETLIINCESVSI